MSDILNQAPVNVLSKETIESLPNMPHDDAKKDILKQISNTHYQRNGVKPLAVAKFFEDIYAPFFDDNGETGQFLQLSFRTTVAKGETMIAVYYGLSKHRLLDAANEALAKNTVDCVYFGVNPRVEPHIHEETGYEKQATSAHVESSAVIWIDIDAKKVNTDDIAQGKKEIIELVKTKLPVQPSIMVDSGNGIHLYFLLDKPYEIALVSNVCQRLEEYIEIADSCHNADRIMRVPFSINRKDRKNPKRTRILKWDSQRYSIEDFHFLPNKAKVKSPFVHVSLNPLNQTMITADELESRITKDRNLIGKINAESLDDYLNTYASEHMKDRTRSGRDFHVICQLLKEGFTPDEIRDIFYLYPVGDKYREKLETQGEGAANRYIATTIMNAITAIEEEKKQQLVSVKIIEKKRY